MNSPPQRYIEIFADCTVDGKTVRVKVWADLLAIATEMASKAVRAKSGRAIEIKGAVTVSVVK